jgi:hypothetical protein
MTGEGSVNGVVHKTMSAFRPVVVQYMQIPMPKNNHIVTLTDVSAKSGKRA